MGAKVFLEPVSGSNDSPGPCRGASRRGTAGALDRWLGAKVDAGPGVEAHLDSSPRGSDLDEGPHQGVSPP